MKTKNFNHLSFIYAIACSVILAIILSLVTCEAASLQKQHKNTSATIQGLDAPTLTTALDNSDGEEKKEKKRGH